MAKHSEAESCCEHCAEKTNIRLVHEDEHVDFCEQEHGHGHESEHAHERGALSTRLLIGGAIVFAAGMVFEIAGAFGWAGIPRLIVFLAAYLLVGGEILIGAGRGIARGHVFDENFLMAVASIGAFAIGEMPEGVAVMLFYRIGEAFEDRAVDHSTRAISALMEVRPEHAYVLTDGVPTQTDPKLVAVGSFIAVRPGERVPLDGVVREGVSSLDTSALTGESMPRRVEPGDEALAGAVNTSGLLTMEVTRPFGESAVVKILKLVQEAGARKAPAENFITKFARYYTPIVVICAVILAFIPPLFAAGAAVSGGGGAGAGSGADGGAGVGFAAAYGQIFFGWVERALIFLVISCPCALVISIPLSYFGGIGGASRQGILVKGGNYLEALARTETVVFDKTGTLTRGKIRVSAVLPANGVSEDELLKLAAAAEQSSTHPIAGAIVAFARERGLEIPPVTGVSEAAGRGAICFVDGGAVTQEAAGAVVSQNGLQEMRAGIQVEIRAGSERLLEEAGVVLPDELGAQGAAGTGTVCHIAVGGRYAGSIGLADELRPDSKAAVSDLRAAGVRQLYMLTGDSEPAAAAVAGEIGLDGYFAGLLPHQKVERLEELAAAQEEKGTLAFVGDGINDAPVLARADIGIAMGGIGSDAAIEAADAVIMADEPSRLVTAIRVAKKTHAIVLQNIVFALGVKGILLVLGALGLANMWMAVFGDVGVAAICVLNSLRALRTR